MPEIEPRDLFSDDALQLQPPGAPAFSKYKAEDGSIIIVECLGDMESPRDAADTGKLVKDLKDDLDKIVSAAQTTLNALKKIAPKELEVEFGIELGGEAGLPLITKGSAKANFKIKMKWHT